MVLNRSIDRWGEPGSQELEELRSRQRAWASRPTNASLAAAVVERVKGFPEDGGLADPTVALEPVDTASGGRYEIPGTLSKKVSRALEAPIEDLVSRRIIPSGEVLAEVLPQITSHVASRAFVDPTLRDLYARIYAAFRRRRSLLLLNLEHQVQIEELPWVEALADFRSAAPGARTDARDTLRDTTLLALTSFPQTILPNPLIQEMDALAKQADLDLPLVEEVAADIFMGTFTVKWRQAAALAADLMEGTLYARYFDLPSASKWAQPGNARGLVERVRTRWGKPVAEDFAEACKERAREAAQGDGSFVARNGTVIEQSQILTTQNLAPVVDRLVLQDEIARRAPGLTSATFEWIVRQQNTRWNSWRSELQMLKNTAYAWRQALFFLSFASEDQQSEAVAALRALVARHPWVWQRRFEPVIVGLDAVVGGASFDALGKLSGGRRFLGWSVGRHWLLPTPSSDSVRRT